MNSKPINAMIMGKSQSGKSSWINSFANYLYFLSLNHAIEAFKTGNGSVKVKCLIPTKFGYGREIIYVDSHGRVYKNEPEGWNDEDSNESNTKLGDSKTRNPRVYPFIINESVFKSSAIQQAAVENVEFSLVDTPGVCDVKGMGQDRLNLRSVITTLSKFNEMHGFMFIIKSNESLDDNVFRYCIKELLCLLHKSAAQNVIFCFTHCTSISGNAYHLVKNVLQELSKNDITVPFSDENIFYFDNEPFQVLCAQQVGFNFSDAKLADFNERWEMSAKEMRRLLNYLSNIDPHMTHQTMSVNTARNVIWKLARALATINTLITLNKKGIDETVEELKNIDLSTADLKEKLKQIKVDLYDLKTASLPYPQTVCTNCYEIDQKGNKLYRVCHEHCYLEGVKRDVTVCPQLKGCEAMSDDGEKCTVCPKRCPWYQHMHIYYRQWFEKTEKKLEDFVGVCQNEKNGTNEKFDANQQMKNECDMKLSGLQLVKSEYESEKKMVRDFGAKSATFLKLNGLLPSNDAIKGSLKEAIEMAKNDGTTSNCIEELEENLALYENELELLMQLHRGKNEITPEEILIGKEELFNLKHTGAKIQEIFDLEDEVQRNYDTHTTPIIINPKPFSWIDAQVTKLQQGANHVYESSRHAVHFVGSKIGNVVNSAKSYWPFRKQ